jgi:hypothetical protein
MLFLHVIPSVSPVHGGPSRAIIDIERAPAARGIEFSTFTTNDDGVENTGAGVVIRMAPEDITGGLEWLMDGRAGLSV